VKRRICLQATCALGATAVVWPTASWSQARTAGRIGYLHPRTIALNHPVLAILRRAWQRLGYVEGDTVLLRSADGDMQRLPALANDLLQRGAGVLIVVGAEAVRVVSRAFKSTPIIAIDLETDPVRAGHAQSFARPGGHVSGLFLDQPSIAGKWIDLLREAAPDMRRLVISWDRATGDDQLEVAKAAARSKGFAATVIAVDTIGNFDVALRPLAGQPRAGIVQLTSSGFSLLASSFAAAALKHGLPVIAFLKAYAHMGLLMTYGPIAEEYFPRAVMMADRILNGERVAEMPIEGPDRFELAINLKTAKALGLTISQTLLLRADELIE
jgi:putative ABC transport system substrate-binding protein